MIKETLWGGIKNRILCFCLGYVCCYSLFYPDLSLKVIGLQCRLPTMSPEWCKQMLKITGSHL